ncbi:MAG: dTMP kinase [Verrucomicrobiota bacterium]|nr:dTMP kinase [Verrucomicrobiota bacterium]
MSGIFISFEGTEGCGKSTQLRALAARLSGAGYDVVETREPGGTVLSEAIRSLLQHDPVGEGMCPETELLLFAASRAQHSRAYIQPAIKANKIVLCDRFMDSTTVYQGVARSLSTQSVDAINKFAVGDSIPDLTILIDLAPEIGLARVQSRGGGELDRMERETLDFFQAVREGYLRLAASQVHRFIIINGDQSPETLEKEIWNGVKQRLT